MNEINEVLSVFVCFKGFDVLINSEREKKMSHVVGDLSPLSG